MSSRLSALEGHLTALQAFQEPDRETFVDVPSLHHLAERFLQLTCEGMFDIAQHIIADEGYRPATGARDVMTVLRDEGFFDEPLAARLQGWMAFRDVLVHPFMESDPRKENDHGRSYDAIQDDLGDIEAFIRAVSRLLPKSPERVG